MAEPISKLREISSNIGDRLIRVMAADPKGSGFHASTFPESEIQSVDDLREDRSALVLHSGAVIPVALPYEELEQKVYSPNVRTDDSPVLDLRAVTGEAARLKVPANSNKCEASKPSSLASELGDKRPDGTILAGTSPDTGKPMYTTPADAPLTMNFKKAADYAKTLNEEKYLGHDDWRVPTRAELNVLFNNRAAIGGFNVSGSDPAGWHWSATPYDIYYDMYVAWCQRFRDGAQHRN